MMNINEWRLLKESIGSGMNLGLSQPTRIGGPIGSQFSEEEFKKDDDDFDDDEDDDEEGLEGDLLGTSDEDEGPTKNFPPDDSEENDGMPPPDEEMLGDDDFDGLDGLDDLGGDPMSGEEMDDFTGADSPAPEAGGDMDFLKDIDPNLLGDEDSEMGGDVPPEMGAGAEMPCPDCNPEGTEEIGDEQCPTCGGEGFVPEEGGDDLGGDPMGAGDEDPFAAMSADAGKDKMVSFMNKGNCAPCEGDDFLNSLARGAHNCLTKKHRDGLQEDSLFSLINPKDVFEEPQAGDVGFAPSNRVGSIGGGYTQNDISDIPVIGESVKHTKKKYPTLSQYAAKRSKR